MKPAPRADYIGSLQRPRALLDEVHRVSEAGHTALLAHEPAKDLSRLHQLEDEAIRGAVARQGCHLVREAQAPDRAHPHGADR